MRTSRAKFEFSEAGTCRALNESKEKAQLEFSANGTWTLNENKQSEVQMCIRDRYTIKEED